MSNDREKLAKAVRQGKRVKIELRRAGGLFTIDKQRFGGFTLQADETMGGALFDLVQEWNRAMHELCLRVRIVEACGLMNRRLEKITADLRADLHSLKTEDLGHVRVLKLEVYDAVDERRRELILRQQNPPPPSPKDSSKDPPL